MRLLVALMLVVAAATGATIAVLLAGGTETRTVTERETVTRTETAETPVLPAEVERTRAAVQAAAAARDWETLRELVPETDFSYSFGGPFEGGAIAYWQDLEATTDDDPLWTLAKILDLPYAVYAGSYIWPFAYNLAPNELTAYERGLLGDLVDDYAGESYYGWRAGFTPEGTWQFYVRGD